MSYTLLFDGQCKICRYLAQNIVQPNKPPELDLNPYQEAQFEKSYPESELKRCEAEIILVNESNGEFLGGIEALNKLLQLLNKFKWLQILLSFKPLKPLAWLVYRMVAWHRYTWFIVPSYLRCSECELQIPKIWNIVFFALFGFVCFGASFLNTVFWIDALAEAAPALFGTIPQPIWLQALYATLIGSGFYLIFTALNFALYKKALSVNKIEVSKQELLWSTVLSLATLLSLVLTNLQNSSLNLLIKSAILIASLSIAQLLILKRFQQIDHGKFTSCFLLVLSAITRSLSPFIVFYFI